MLLIVSVVVLAGFSTIYSSSVTSVGDALRAHARGLRERLETRLVIAAIYYNASAGELHAYVKNVGERSMSSGELSALSVYLYSNSFFEGYVYGSGPGSWSYEIVSDSHSNGALDWGDTMRIVARPSTPLSNATYLVRIVTGGGAVFEESFSVGG